MSTSKEDDAHALAMQQHMAALQMQQQIAVMQEQQQAHQDDQQEVPKDAQQEAHQDEQQQALQQVQQEAQHQALQLAHQEAQQEALQLAQQEAQQEALQLAQQEAQQEALQLAQQEAQQEALQLAQQEVQQKALQLAQQAIQQKALQLAQQEVQQKALQLAQQEAQQKALQLAQQEAQQKALQLAQQEVQQKALQQAQQEAQQLALQQVQLAHQEAQHRAQQEAQQLAQHQAHQEAQHRVQQEAHQLAQQEAQQLAQQETQQQALHQVQQSPTPPLSATGQPSPPQQALNQHLTHQHTQTAGGILGEENENDKLEGEPSQVICHSVAVQTQTDPEFETPLYNVITEDGPMAYDDGVRVLRAIGSWGQEYATAAQIQDQNGETYITETVNGTPVLRTVLHGSSIPDGINVVPNSPVGNAAGNAVANMASSSARPVSLAAQDAQAAANKPPADKAFTCPVCNKGLARKDKLVIHMRIHTGEKPYVCEVCERAFARRDKLVMHMNKLKHLTPTNIAPLGKRQHPVATPVASPVPDKRHDTKAIEDAISVEIGSPASSIDLQPAALVQVVHDQPSMTWNCELCGRICTSREEWTLHARSHLDGDNSFSSTSVSSSLSVLTPLSPYQYSASSPERHICMVCRQEFSSKTDFVLHMRGHFVGKPELLASHVAGLVDSTGMCT